MTKSQETCNEKKKSAFSPLQTESSSPIERETDKAGDDGQIVTGFQ